MTALGSVRPLGLTVLGRRGPAELAGLDHGGQRVQDHPGAYQRGLLRPVVGRGAFHDLDAGQTVPHERSPKPHGRPDFLTAQTEPIDTTLDLFEAWREKDADAMRQLLFGSFDPPVAETKPPARSIESAVLKRGWFRRR